MGKVAKPITVYADGAMRKKIEEEASRRRRKLGPTILEILIEYFEQKQAEADFTKVSNAIGTN